jgi:DNA-binding IclR family transcriptional regulator
MPETFTKVAELQKASQVGGPPPIRSLSRGLGILGQFTADSGSLSLTELSRRTGLHRATVYRFVKTLETEGYLTSVGSGLYGIGPAWAIALYALGSDTVFAEILGTDLEALAESTHETAALGVRRGDSVQIVHVLPPSRSFVPRLPPGYIYPLHVTWNVHCQILLAFSSEDTKRRMLAVRQTRFTEHTVVDPQAIRTRLAQVRKEGVAYDREEFYVGTCAVAVPVMSRGRAVAALGLIVPVERFTDEAVTSLITQLTVATDDMQKRLDAQTGETDHSSTVDLARVV